MIILYKVEIKNWGARDCGTPQKWRMKMCTWKRKNRQELVFPTVFPRNYDTPRDLIYMLYLDWYDAKFSRKSGSFQKQCVFPLFFRQIKKELRFYLNCLIFIVDQPGLEPGTSRLWVGKIDISRAFVLINAYWYSIVYIFLSYSLKL